MRVYWVFRNDQYYPSCGLEDLLSTHQTYDEALEYVNNLPESKNCYTEIINIEEYL